MPMRRRERGREGEKEGAGRGERERVLKIQERWYNRGMEVSEM